MEIITIFIVDDHALVREAWSLILNSNLHFRVVGESNSGEDAIKKIKILVPKIVIMDINLPGMNGIEATEQILKFLPSTKILGVSMHRYAGYARRMMQAGASGYVTKNSSSEEMFQAIIDIENGGTYVCKDLIDGAP